MPLSTHQLADGLRAAIDEKLRAAREIVDRDFVHVGAQIVVKRGEYFAEGHGPFHRFAAEPVSRADDLPGLHPAAEEHGAGDARPMIASAVLVDRRRAAELAPNDDRNVLVTAAL